MELLFVGLIALGTAMAIVVLLKCICFVGEFFNSQHEQQMAPSAITAAAPNNSEAPRYNVQRLSDRVHMIFVEHKSINPSPAFKDEAPPTYEEALRLINNSHSNAQ